DVCSSDLHKPGKPGSGMGARSFTQNIVSRAELEWLRVPSHTSTRPSSDCTVAPAQFTASDPLQHPQGVVYVVERLDHRLAMSSDPTPVSHYGHFAKQGLLDGEGVEAVHVERRIYAMEMNLFGHVIHARSLAVRRAAVQQQV